MKWNHLAIYAKDVGITEGMLCAMCNKIVTDIIFFPQNFNVVNSLLENKDFRSGLEVKHRDYKEFNVCEDCKSKLDELLNKDSIQHR